MRPSVVRFALGVLACALISGCDAPDPTPQPFAVDARQQQGDAPSRQRDPGVARRVAVSHAFVLRLPGAEIEAIQRRHIDTCRALGCSILKTGLDRYIDSQTRAETSVRIAPGSLAEFVAALSAAPARIVSHTETAEDQTLSFLDVERRLAAKTALRERLETLLRDPALKTPAELIAIEKEIAQVQGDIESMTGQRDHLLTITETVKVDVHYLGTAAEVGRFDFSRIAESIERIDRTVVNSVGLLISFVAFLVPWLPLVALLLWLVRRVLRRRRAQV